MANPEQVKLLRESGVSAWNRHLDREGVVPIIFSDGKYLSRPTRTQIDLVGADLSGLDLTRIDLYRADLTGANLQKSCLEGAVLRGAILHGADLSESRCGGADLFGASLSLAQLRGAKLPGAHLHDANLWQAKCSGTDFTGANLTRADLSDAYLFGAGLEGARLSGARLSNAELTLVRLSHANLSGANLDRANLHKTDLSNADLSYASFVETSVYECSISGARVYGISAWDVDLTETSQQGLVITPPDQPAVTVDDLEVAQFVYLLLNRAKLRNVIDTVTSKAVLLLGRFTPERKAVLEALSGELRAHNLVPIVFDFERSKSRDFTETIKTLAGISLFVIVDITRPKSSPLELQATVPDYQIPFVTIIQEGEEPFSMFSDLKGKYDWVLAPVSYPSTEVLLQIFKRAILERAWEKRRELAEKKVEEMKVLSAESFLMRETQTD